MTFWFESKLYQILKLPNDKNVNKQLAAEENFWVCIIIMI